MSALLKKLLALIGVDTTPTVAKATSLLTKAVAGLEDAVEHHNVLAAVYDKAVVDATKLKNDAEGEVAKAKAVIANVKALFHPAQPVVAVEVPQPVAVAQAVVVSQPAV